ncbi:MAG: 2-amino-4-hydroxy-6-hydroxymethyldihydropteridine diphosphokinase [Candidatus Cloacimonadota bacterium]|nr:MAG: 2-amino-4-hydroxy-6-hydroxymethyldihydropteridine diphosphokinase [Candidatus Cloacimonadota bacterium]
MPVLKLEEKSNNKRIVYIGFGSNLLARRKNIEKALKFMNNAERIDVISVSPLYESEPYGYKEQSQFINGVAKITTSLSPFSLLIELKKIEREMGRRKVVRWGPRIIDLDILFYDNIIFNAQELVIPHPELHKRWFVLQPLNDIEPDLKHPVLKKNIHQLLQDLRRLKPAVTKKELNGRI